MLPPAGNRLATRLLSLERQQIKHKNLDAQCRSEIFPVCIAHVSHALRLTIHNGFRVQGQILIQSFPVLGQSNIFSTLAFFQHADIPITT